MHQLFCYVHWWQLLDLIRSALLIPTFLADVDDHDDKTSLPEAIDYNEVDEDDVEDFKNSDAYEDADDEIQDCRT